MTPDVVVIGGGCAGLAAATALAESGAAVQVLEARPYPGGRSRSWIAAESRDPEDNGQHVLMACYDEFLAFVRRTGGESELSFQERSETVLLEPDASRSVLRPWRLPRPFDLFFGLAGLRGFPMRDALRLHGWPGRPPRPERTVEGWLDDLAQSESSRRVFWRPLTFAALNLDPARAPASLLNAVLNRAFRAGPGASRIGFARRGLTPLIVDPAVRYLAERRSTVRTRAAVVAIDASGGKVSAVVLADGSRQPAGAAVLAVPHDAAARLLPAGASAFDGAAAEALSASAIVAVHLWFDRAVLDDPMVGLLDSPFHWAFDRARIGGARPPGYVALVTSAAGALAAAAPEAITALARAELPRFLPRARDARLLRARVVKERRATPAFRPATEPLRPGTRTAIDNLVLAGDWTATGLPATLEGAAASGHAAASCLTV